MMSAIKRYECKLSAEDMNKAVLELNEPENNDERLSRIDQLRDAFNSQDSDVILIRDDDEFLLRFLRAKKFNHEKALKTLMNYHQQRRNWPEVFDKVQKPILLKPVLDAGCFVSLSQKAVDGSSVVIGRPGKVENPLMTDFVATLTLTMEQLLEEERTQIYGITVIEDLSYMGMEMMQQMGPIIGKRFVNWLQDAMPMRVKAVNFVNEPKIFDVVFAIVRPFMKEKMKKRLRLHGTTFKTLHQLIDPSVLPPAYGGSGARLDGEVVAGWRDVILGEEDTYL